MAKFKTPKGYEVIEDYCCGLDEKGIDCTCAEYGEKRGYAVRGYDQYDGHVSSQTKLDTEQEVHEYLSTCYDKRDICCALDAEGIDCACAEERGEG